MINSKNSATKGFTLIELSIVIVIIGLIVAGVVAGQSLVEQSNLMNFGLNIEQNKTAIRTYKLTYGQMPGDHSTAKNYFPSCTDSGGNFCNGNGDNSFGAVGSSESYRIWQHLTLAGLLPGSYTGIYSVLEDCDATNTPGYPLKAVCLYARTRTDMYKVPPASIGHHFHAETNSNVGIYSPALTYKLDKKFDDGLADRGNISVENDIGSSNCVSAFHTSPRSYNLNNTDALCRLFIFFN